MESNPYKMMNGEGLLDAVRAELGHLGTVSRFGSDRHFRFLDYKPDVVTGTEIAAIQRIGGRIIAIAADAQTNEVYTLFEITDFRRFLS